MRFSLRMFGQKPTNRPHKAAIICPCKGIDTTFEKNMSSLFHQDHPDYEIIFVVENESDPAYTILTRLIEEYRDKMQACKVAIVVAGYARNNSQKVHNLLAATEAVMPDREVFAFVDSDGWLPEYFLHSLGSQLRRTDRNIATTGYRWFVPEDNALSSHTMSAMNAFFAGLLGDHRWNSTWGGAMAILKDNFYKCKVDQIWQGALSDDYSMTWAVRNNSDGIVYYMPLCLLPSFEKTTWHNLIHFARRQFIITRRCLPGLWWMALAGFSQYIIAFWGGLAYTLYLWSIDSPLASKAAILPGITLAGGFIKACLRQYTAMKKLSEWKSRLVKASLIDIFLFPILSVFTWILITSTIFSKSVIWRNNKYTIESIDKTIIE